MKVSAVFQKVPADLFQQVSALGSFPVTLKQQVRRIPNTEGPSSVGAHTPELKPHAFTPTQEHVTLVEYSLPDDAFEKAHTLADKLRELGAEEVSLA
jgi:hypothetical protein